MPDATVPWIVMWSEVSKIMRYSLYSFFSSSMPLGVSFMRCLLAPRSRTMSFSSNSSRMRLDADCWLISRASPSSRLEIAT